MDVGTALELATHIYGLIEKYSKNRKTLREVSHRLVDDIQQLEDVRKNCDIGNTMPELDQEIAAYQSDLRSLLHKCEKIFQEKPGFRGKVSHFIDTRISVGDIEEKLIEIQKKAELAQRKFERINQIKSRKEIRDLQLQFQSTAARLEESLRSQSDNRDQKFELAQEEVQMQVQNENAGDSGNDWREEPEGSVKGFTRLDAEVRHREGRKNWEHDESSENEISEEEGVGHLTPDVSRLSLNEEPHGDTTVSDTSEDDAVKKTDSDKARGSPTGASKTPPQNKNTENDSDDEDDSEDQHLLTSEVATPSPSRVSQKRGDEHQSRARQDTEKPPMTKDDAVQQTLKLLHDIRDPDSHTLVKKWISKANNLSATLEQKFKMIPEARQLSELCASLTQQILDDVPAATSSPLASNLRTFARRIWNFGRPYEALERSEKAVAAYRQLADEDPKTYEPQLASVLKTMSMESSKIGRYKDAIEPIEEAIDIMRDLVQCNRRKYVFDLAMVLSRYSILLSKLYRFHAALGVRREVVGIQEELVDQDPEKYNPYLANALGRLSNTLAENRKYREALDVQIRHVNLRRKISEKDLEKHATGIIKDFVWYSDSLADQKYREKALEAAEQAVGLSEWLARDNGTGGVRQIHDRNEEGEEEDEDSDDEESKESDDDDEDSDDEESEESDDDDEPNPHNALLATALTVLHDRLSELHRDAEAVKAILRATDLWYKLEQRSPDKYKLKFAKSLNKLSDSRSVAGLHEEALKAADCAVEQWEDLADSDNKYLLNLGRAYETVSLRLSKVGRDEDALEAINSSLKIRRKLYDRDGRARKPDLAHTLVTRSSMLVKVGRRMDSLGPAKEAVGIYRQLAGRNPKKYQHKLALSLHDYAGRLSSAGRKEQAVKAVSEAIDVYKQLAKDDPDSYKKQLAKSTDLRVKLRSNLIESDSD